MLHTQEPQLGSEARHPPDGCREAVQITHIHTHTYIHICIYMQIYLKHYITVLTAKRHSLCFVEVFFTLTLFYGT